MNGQDVVGNPRKSFLQSFLPSVSFCLKSQLFSCLNKILQFIYPRNATIDQTPIPVVSVEIAPLRLNSKWGSIRHAKQKPSLTRSLRMLASLTCLPTPPRAVTPQTTRGVCSMWDLLSISGGPQVSSSALRAQLFQFKSGGKIGTLWGHVWLLSCYVWPLEDFFFNWINYQHLKIRKLHIKIHILSSLW